MYYMQIIPVHVVSQKKEIGNSIKISLDGENGYININNEIIPETIQRVKNPYNLHDKMGETLLNNTEFYKIKGNIFAHFTNISKIQYFNRKNNHNKAYILFAIETKEGYFLGYYSSTKSTPHNELFSNTQDIKRIILLRKSANFEDLSGMFGSSTDISEIIFMKSFDTSNVTNMSFMFNGCRNLELIIGLDNFNTSKVTNMSNMFSGCSSLKKLNLEKFNTSNVTNMCGMFNECSSLKELKLTNFNTSNVTDTSYMFYECSSLKELNIKNFDTSNVKEMTSMFSGCSSLKELKLTNFNTSNVTNTSYMFYGCSSLQKLDLSNFDTTKVVKMDGMFIGCSSLKNLNIKNIKLDDDKQAEEFKKEIHNAGGTVKAKTKNEKLKDLSEKKKLKS